jgi:hypothetical protein
VVLLIHKRKLSTPSVLLDGGLRSAFTQLLDALFPNWSYAAKVEYPFRHLENDGIWKLIPIDGASAELRAARDVKAEAWDVLRHVRCAKLEPEVFDRLAAKFDARVRALQILWETYFPPDAAMKLMRFMTQDEEALAAPGPIFAREGHAFTEKALEEHLEQHWEETPFSQMGIELARREVHGFAGRQVFTPVNAIDLLGYREKSREWWVFELKRGRPSDAVVGQVSRYLSWIEDERKQHRERTLGAIIARRADRKLLYAARANPRLSVWEYDDHLALHRVS